LGENGVPNWAPNAHVSRGAVHHSGTKLTGYHSRPGGIDSGREVFDDSSRIALPNGAYSGQWRMGRPGGSYVTKPNGSELSKSSTFWPDHMSLEDIGNATAEAYQNARRVGPTGLSFIGEGGGHRVKAWLDAQGDIVTSFPVRPEVG